MGRLIDFGTSRRKPSADAARIKGAVPKYTSASHQLICLNDLFATCAGILGQRLPDNAGEDSVSILPVLEGQARKPLREALVHHSMNGSFAIRQDNWKLEFCPDSGGWSAPIPGSAAAKRLPKLQLYDLSEDIAETTNVQAAHPDVVKRLTRLLEKYVADGRSTPGAPQQNTTPVDFRKMMAGEPLKDAGYAGTARKGRPRALKLPPCRPGLMIDG